MADQTTALLDHLVEHGSKAFGCFLESLKDDYEWLAEQLEEAVDLADQKPENEDTVDSVELVLYWILLMLSLNCRLPNLLFLCN